jgi:hypothetical protein
MRSTHKLLAAACAVAALLAVPAAAHPTRTAAGSFNFLTDQKTPIGQAHGTVFIREVASIEYSGGLSGVVQAVDTLVVRADGSVTGFGSESCRSCTIGGRTGSFTAGFAFHGDAAGIAGRETFTHGSGGLAGLHGGGSFQGGPAGNTYSYYYRFAPVPSAP